MLESVTKCCGGQSFLRRELGIERPVRQTGGFANIRDPDAINAPFAE